MNKIRVRVIKRAGIWVAEARSRPFFALNEVEVPHYNNGFIDDDEGQDWTRIVWIIKQDGVGKLSFVAKGQNPLQIYHTKGGVKDLTAPAYTYTPALSDKNPDGSDVFRNLRRLDKEGDGHFEQLTIDVYNKNTAAVGSALYRQYAYTLTLNYRNAGVVTPVTIDPMISNYSEYD